MPPKNHSQSTWVGARRAPIKVSPTGQVVRVMVIHIRVMVRHIFIVRSESYHVKYS